MKGLNLNKADIVMKPIGLAAGMFLGEKINTAIESLDPGTMDFLKDSPAMIGFGKVLLGAFVPGMIGGKSKSGTLNKLIPSLGDGLVASGMRDLLIDFKVMTGVSGVGNNDYIMLPDTKRNPARLNGNY